MKLEIKLESCCSDFKMLNLLLSSLNILSFPYFILLLFFKINALITEIIVFLHCCSLSSIVRSRLSWKETIGDVRALRRSTWTWHDSGRVIYLSLTNVMCFFSNYTVLYVLYYRKLNICFKNGDCQLDECTIQRTTPRRRCMESLK